MATEAKTNEAATVSKSTTAMWLEKADAWQETAT
jgi:hypothetical protein